MSNIIKTDQKSPKQKRKSFAKKLTIIATVVLVLGGAAYASYWYWSTYLSDPTLENITDDEKTEAVKTIEGSYVDVGEDMTLKARYVLLTDRGDLDSAQKAYQQAIDAVSDDAKLTLLKEFYIMAVYREQYGHALDAALGLVKLRPGFETYNYVALSYEKLNDNQKAVEYLGNARSLLDPKNKADQGAIEYIDNKIGDLEGTYE